MIIDRLEKRNFYKAIPMMAQALDFIADLGPQSEEGEYPLRGEEMFARVMSYNTKVREEAVLETHERYVDIQSTLIGAEGIEWFYRDDLTIKTPFDKANDVAFYEHPEKTLSRVDVFPGMFALLWPTDAHMPQLFVGEGIQEIKKVVVKIDHRLLAEEFKKNS